ncbi:hypothetical protein NLO80_19535, partial [Escherichia coli]|nr:hypothetical protein [Escherichia coli]
MHSLVFAFKNILKNVINILGMLNIFLSVRVRRKDIKDKLKELNKEKEQLKSEEIIIDLYKKKLASSKGKANDKIKGKIIHYII